MTEALGKFIVIEGLEGAGKSTALESVRHRLDHHHIPFLTVREPGSTSIGETLRTILKNSAYKDVLDNKSELLLMYASRIQLLEEVIKPALKQGTWVLADRFELSTFAYQGGGRGLDEGMIKQLSAFCLQGFKPDLTFYLDINPELGMKRAGLRGQLDRIEQQSMAFFYRTHEAYREQLEIHPEIVSCDASLPLDEVQAKIQNILDHFIMQSL